MKYLKWVLFCNILCLLLLSCSLNRLLHETTIYSDIIGCEYTLYIYTPQEYDTTSSNYPVIYVLDGDEAHDSTSGKIFRLIEEEKIPPMIMVAIGYGDGKNQRSRDYTPTTVSSQSSGGAQNFFQFLKIELIPFIESEYRAIPDPGSRYFTGHSFGGLAGIYGLFYYNDTFTNFIVTSPSLWWDNEVIFQYETDFAALNSGNSLFCKMYVSVGSLEGGGMNCLFLEFVKRVKSRDYRDFAFHSSIIKGKRHWNNRFIALEEGLNLLF